MAADGRAWLGWPEALVLAGCALAFAGNGIALALLLVDPPASWLTPVALHVLGVVVTAAPPVLLRARRARTPRHFVLVAVLATAVAVLTLGGLLGGIVALAGAVWGLLATYEPVPDRR